MLMYIAFSLWPVISTVWHDELSAVWQLDMSAMSQWGCLWLVCLSTQLHVLFVERCFNCNSVRHFARDCPEERKRCDNCNKLGHLAKDCPAHQQPRMSLKVVASVVRVILRLVDPVIGEHYAWLMFVAVCILLLTFCQLHLRRCSVR